MGDPFSIVSGTAGVVSLGITVCSGLLDYYSSWKDSDENIATMYASLEGLTKTFKVIRDTIKRSSFTADVADRVLESTKSCEDGVNSLEKRLKKLRDPNSIGLESKIRIHARKALYPFKESTLVKLREIISDLRDNLILAIDALQIETSRISDERIVALAKDVQSTSTGIDELKHGQTVHRIKAESEERLKILTWLSPLTFGTRLSEMLDRKAADTGIWLLESEQFTSWVNGSIEVLWCPGMPGAGKTILASIIIDHLQRTFRGAADIGLSYVYCIYNATGQTVNNLLASLLEQLCRQQGSEVQEIEELYALHVRNKTRPSVPELSRSLQNQVRRFGKVFIVIDALDECPENDRTREVFLGELRKLPSNIRILVTSRPNTLIEYAFAGASRLDIYAHDDDVRRHVVARLDTQSLLAKHVTADPSLQDAIISKILEKSQGMFLLAELHLDSLARLGNRRLLRRALDSLPEKLNETYDNAVQRIQNLDSASTECANKVLSWVLFAQRPVTIEELRCALGVEPDDSFLDEEALPDRNYLLSVCCGLIITSEDNDIVRFVHYTTQEYFERARHPQLSAAQRYLAHVCITYLSFSAFSKESFLESTNKGSESSAEESGVVHQRRRSDELGRVKDSISLRSREHVLLDYAAQYWGTHAREAIRRDPAINAMVTKFLAKKANVFNSMAVLYCDDDNLDNVTLQRFYYQSIPRNATNLHVAATFGLESLTLELLDEGALLDTRDSEGRTALHSSSVHGHTVVAQMLLDKGANPNLKDRQGSDALWYAAAAGHEPVVRLLLSNGQVLPAMERIISHAASKGHSRIIQIMLESVKDVTIKTTYLESAITRASGTGQEDWVRLLLDLGKDLERDVMRLYLGKALLHAASSNNCVIMQLLLEQGADVNHKAGNKATPLHVAAFSGGKEAVVYLLDNGAEIESAGRKWNRPIHDAMNGESEEVLVILLERGADVNAYVWDNWTPLIVASAKGDANLIPHLLRHGADVEARDKTFNRTAIQRAVLEGHVSAVQMLLTSQYSASMKEGLLALTHYYHVLDDNPDREDDQPDVSQLLLNVQNTFSDDLKKLLLLHRPSSKGDEATVRTFIAMGADINASSYDGDTALHRAAGKGHLKIVRLLLDHGALLEASYNRSGEIPGITPLGSAVEKNHYNTVQLLLDEGADIEHDARWSCGTPLMGAACESNFDIARLLLEHGADPNTKSDSDFGANALDAALNEFRPDLISLNYIQLLIKKGANIEAKNDYGETALCTAVTHGWVEAVSLLLEYGADPNAVQETTEPWDEFTYEEDFSNSMQLIRDAKQRQAEDPERLASENVM